MELQIITKFAYNLLQASCKSVKIISHAGSTDLLQPRAKDLLAPGIQIDIISFNRLRLLFELRFSAFYISMDLIAILPRKPFILKNLQRSLIYHRRCHVADNTAHHSTYAWKHHRANSRSPAGSHCPYALLSKFYSQLNCVNFTFGKTVEGTSNLIDSCCDHCR